jgi:hypothetical protein
MIAMDTTARPKLTLRLPALLVIMLVALTGCAADPYVTVTDWTIVTPEGARAAVHAPRRLDDLLRKHPSLYVLEADVPLSRQLRGQGLTLSWEDTDAFATLIVDGERIQPLSATPFDRIRPSERELVFRIPLAVTERDVLHLALEVQHIDTWTASTGLPPRLAAATYGEHGARVERTIERLLLTALEGVFSLLALGAGMSFALDRRRAADGWFALFALNVAVNYLARMGLTQVVDPRDIVRVPIWTTTVICICGTRFTEAYFSLKRGKTITVALAALGGAALALRWRPFNGAFNKAPVGSLVNVLTVLTIAYLAVVLVRVARRTERRFEALVMLGLWVQLALTSVLSPNLVGLVKLRHLSWSVFVITQAVLLLRQHARALRSLGVALEERVVTLEERNRDVSRLNEELRHQIHDRSARLADALGRIGRLSVKTLEPPAIGATVGHRYKIVARIGEGGMGTVYEAERTTDGRRFALKTLLEADSGAWLARLAREAQAATAIAHPNVVGIVDIDVDTSGFPFVVMELVKGQALSQHRARFGDATFARAVVQQIAAGLSALHEVGIVHRDLKPSNILLENRPGDAFCAKIVDFGIARVASDTGPEFLVAESESVLGTDGFRALVEDASLTGTGLVMGTPLYMAPELATGVKDAPASSDIWSLGVVAYELASGRLPLGLAPTMASTAGPGSLPGIKTESLAEPLRAVVARCLDVEPTRRPTAAEVAAALA